MHALGLRPSGLRHLIALGAHPDDVEIGCGGLLLSLGREAPDLVADIVVLTGTPSRIAEAHRAAALFLPGHKVALHCAALPDGRLPALWGRVKQALEEVAARGPADLVLAPRRSDAHQDHRTVAEQVTTVWRDHLVLGYEIPKWDGDLDRPTVYVPVEDDVMAEKVRLLQEAFPSQSSRDWFDPDVFLGLARLRGMECRSRYAEAFTTDKTVVQW
ncbi:MAG TPA: PIG-L family deacetylase [Kineosporiaceae bacterium]